MKERYYENYPAWMIVLSNLVSLLIYLSGAIIIYQLGVIYFILYLGFILFLEYRLLRYHCINCYYYGKACCFGQGKIALLFKQGNSKNFCKMKLSWKDLFIDMLVSIIPVIAGIILIIKNFDWVLLILVILIVLLTSFGNAFIRSQLACRYCKQRKLGCPAQKLFERR